uniref:Uncharacterized protein n=1 Tax=Sinocyclocheilus anshuiensis TaxID=1608454 RepID=A0A671Q9D8_9TELE
SSELICEPICWGNPAIHGTGFEINIELPLKTDDVQYKDITFKSDSGITLMKTLPQKECASGCVDVCAIQTDGSELYELNITTCTTLGSLLF